MSIKYREITVDATAPSSPGLGEIWIKPVGAPDTYNAYVWLNAWITWAGGGVYIAEADRDKHYLNVILQNTVPDDVIKPGWFWVNTDTLQMYLYIFDYLVIASA